MTTAMISEQNKANGIRCNSNSEVRKCLLNCYVVMSVLIYKVANYL